MKHKESVILWGMVVVLMLGIFYMSSQPSNKSNATSYKLIRKIAYIIKPEYKHMLPVEQKNIVIKYNHVTRKIAHATIYFLLSALSFTALGQHNKTRKHRIMIALIICAIFAISDELHQGFVPGRSPQLTDIFIDFLGAVLAIMVCRNIYK